MRLYTIGKETELYIKRYSELFSYGLLLMTLLLYPKLSIFILLSPLLFVSLRWRDPWIITFLLIPLLIPLGFSSRELLKLTFSAFSEELFFRAYLMQRFSNLWTSFMFALAHLALYKNPSSLLTFFPSLVFGYAYAKTQSLWLVSFLHLLSNVFYWRFLV